MLNYQKTYDCYNFLKGKEGQIVSLEQIAQVSGWTLGTVKTYVNKKWMWFCHSQGYGTQTYLIKGFNLSEEDFLKLQTQKYQYKNLSDVKDVDSTPYYDVALSFAGENRSYVEDVAKILQAFNIKVFYDLFEETELWGKNLYEYLIDIYQKKSKYCVIFISEHYKNKMWTNHERVAAQARAFTETESYILPVRFDLTEIPGVLPTTGYLDLTDKAPQDLAILIAKKLNKFDEISEVIEFCRQSRGEEYEIELKNGEILFTMKPGLNDYIYSFNPLALLGFYRDGPDKLDLFLWSGYIGEY